MRQFLVCLHDGTPAYGRETRVMLHDLAPLLGRRLSVGVVPNWHGAWPLTIHRDYCRQIQERAEEILLHGYFHQRQRGAGPISVLSRSSDEMNGLDADETRRSIECGQRMFVEVFGVMPRGFLAPAWQRGHAQQADVDYVLGFFSLQSRVGRTVPLATWSWDCGRWGWLGHIGHGIGWLSQSMDLGIPTLAIHPMDLERGYWPKILRLIEDLLEDGYDPSTPARLFEATRLP